MSVTQYMEMSAFQRAVVYYAQSGLNLDYKFLQGVHYKECLLGEISLCTYVLFLHHPIGGPMVQL